MQEYTWKDYGAGVLIIIVLLVIFWPRSWTEVDSVPSRFRGTWELQEEGNDSVWTAEFFAISDGRLRVRYRNWDGQRRTHSYTIWLIQYQGKKDFSGGRVRFFCSNPANPDRHIVMYQVVFGEDEEVSITEVTPTGYNYEVDNKYLGRYVKK